MVNVKSFIYSTICALFLIFSSCGDSLTELGGNIYPPGDGVEFGVDSVYLTAKTVSMEDSIFARTIKGVLGEYDDPTFGKVKSDYMCQFYNPGKNSLYFKEGFISIDSVFFSVDFTTFYGDTTAQMGVSVYEVNRSLDRNFYTKFDPAEYYSKSDLLGQTAYSIAGVQKNKLPNSSVFQRLLSVDLGVGFGQRFYDAYHNSNAFNDDKTFNEFFKGMYVTNTMGSGALINLSGSSIDIYYSYNDPMGNHDNTADTVRMALFTLSATPEVIQMNRVQNAIPNEIFNDPTATYLKTPAGVCTEFKFPLQDVLSKMTDKNGVVDTSLVINMASLSVKGYSEKESAFFGMNPSRPSRLLLIDKDSMTAFFERSYKVVDEKSRVLASLNTTTNTYNFNNLSSLISHYRTLGLTTDPVFVLVPVDVELTSSGTTTNVYHYMKPSTAILRADGENLKFKFAYTKFKE